MPETATWEGATGRLERATALLAAHIPVRGNATLLQELLAERQAAIDGITTLDPALCTAALLERIRASVREGDLAVARAQSWHREIESSLVRAARLQAALTAGAPPSRHVVDCQG